MRQMLVLLLVLFVLLQYQLWFSPGGIQTAYQLNKKVLQQSSENKILADRNAVLMVDIEDLKKGTRAIEERARNDLGMIKKGEIFYQVVK